VPGAIKQEIHTLARRLRHLARYEHLQAAGRALLSSATARRLVNLGAGALPALRERWEELEQRPLPETLVEAMSANQAASLPPDLGRSWTVYEGAVLSGSARASETTRYWLGRLRWLSCEEELLRVAPQAMLTTAAFQALGRTEVPFLLDQERAIQPGGARETLLWLFRATRLAYQIKSTGWAPSDAEVVEAMKVIAAERPEEWNEVPPAVISRMAEMGVKPPPRGAASPRRQPRDLTLPEPLARSGELAVLSFAFQNWSFGWPELRAELVARTGMEAEALDAARDALVGRGWVASLPRDEGGELWLATYEGAQAVKTEGGR